MTLNYLLFVAGCSLSGTQCTQVPAYNEFGYHEHSSVTSGLFSQKTPRNLKCENTCCRCLLFAVLYAVHVIINIY